MAIVHLKNSSGVITEYTVTPPQTITGLAAGTYTFTEGLTQQSVTVAASGGGTPTPTPAPSFTAQPTVSPSSGTAGTTTFTATPGTVSNGSVTSRAWMLAGTSVSTGLTFAPTSGQTGTAMYQETATGTGGTTLSNTVSVTIAASGGGTPTNRVSNGDFATDLTGWTLSPAGGTGAAAWDADGALVTRGAETTLIYQLISGLTQGATYTVKFDRRGVSGAFNSNVVIRAGVLATDTLIANAGSKSTAAWERDATFTFVAGAVNYLHLQSGGTAGAVVQFDNVSITAV